MTNTGLRCEFDVSARCVVLCCVENQGTAKWDMAIDMGNIGIAVYPIITLPQVTRTLR